MKIQRFRSKTAQEAMSLARLALGPEAVLLQTRRVHAAGFLRLFACPQVEILAAVDSGSSRSPASGYPAAGARNTPAGGTWGEAGTERVGTATRCGGGGAQRGAGPRDDLTSDWRSEVAALRREVASMRLQLGVLGCNAAGGGQHAGTYPGGGAQRGAGPRAHRPPADGASGETEAPCLSHPADPSLPAMEMAHRLLADLMTCPIEIRDGACTVVALVGPTGAGKTTTIAKLAAVATRVEQKRVAFIAADTYRIGAVEQLETYARLLEVPMSVAYTLDDVQSARDQYASYDLVLVDTVGRSPRNGQQLEELAGLLDRARPDEVHLALDARGSYATHQSVLRGFRPLRPTHLLLGKLDETPRLEDSLAAVLEGGLPLSYVTTGQRVPEDLAAADTAQLAAWLIGGHGVEVRA